jgi:hypothetical protein
MTYNAELIPQISYYTSLQMGTEKYAKKVRHTRQHKENMDGYKTGLGRDYSK